MRKKWDLLTTRELTLICVASLHKLDENGDIKDTAWNRSLYRLSCKIAGGKEKLDPMCGVIKGKLEALGIDTNVGP